MKIRQQRGKRLLCGSASANSTYISAAGQEHIPLLAWRTVSVRTAAMEEGEKGRGEVI